MQDTERTSLKCVSITRILDAVEFYREDHLTDAYRSVLGRLPGWSRKATEREGRWRFVAFSRGAGESGDRMLHVFRTANRLSGSRFDSLFIHRSDLLREKLKAEDTVVFVDDFAGTGDQAVAAWDESLSELLPDRPRMFLVLVVAVDRAMTRIGNDTPFNVKAFRRLGRQHNLFTPQCVYFSSNEKGRILEYCNQADGVAPRGYGDCGVLLVFAHRCPDNSIPVLHSRGPVFRGLFPR